MRSCGCADLGHTCELGAGDRRSNLNPQAELPEEDGEGQVARLAPGDLALSLLPVQLGAQRILGGAHLQAIKQSSNHHQEAIRNRSRPIGGYSPRGAPTGLASMGSWAVPCAASSRPARGISPQSAQGGRHSWCSTHST